MSSHDFDWNLFFFLAAIAGLFALIFASYALLGGQS